MTGPSVVAVVPEALMTQFFSESDLGRMNTAAELIGAGGEIMKPNDGGPAFVRVDALSDVPDLSCARVVVTSWGAPPFDADRLAELPALELVIHTGASIRPFATEELFDRGILVTQAGEGMARSVAEVSLAFTLALLHRIPQMNDAVRGRSGGWWPDGVQHEILGSAVAVVGASRTGRAYISLLQALGARPLLVDPTLSVPDAAELGVPLLALDDALAQARIVALHAPTLPETHHLIGARELAILPDGAGVVNTARSWLVDETALQVELSSGRLSAAIDVFDEEPLPRHSPFRTLPGVLVTPHRAAGTQQGRRRQGSIVVDELTAFAAGRPLQHAVSRDQLATMG